MVSGVVCCVLAPHALFIDIFSQRSIVWMTTYINQVQYLREQVSFKKGESGETLARQIYLETLRQMVLGLNLGQYELSVNPRPNSRRKHKGHAFSTKRREEGSDWPGFAFTMAGSKRLQSVQTLLELIFRHQVPGDVMETGENFLIN